MIDSNIAAHRGTTYPALVPLVVVVVGAVVGLLAALGRLSYSHVLVTVAVCCLLALYWLLVSRWRLGIYALLAFLPFAGVPTILLYPAPSVTTLVKDFLFVVPAYVGFVLWWAERRRRVPRLVFPGAPILLLAGLSILLVAQLLNPMVTNRMVGLIGLKVWLFYVPLMFLGYHLIDSRRRLRFVANLMLIAGVVPVLLGLVEAVLIYSGQRQVVYALYGPAAAAVTQEFARLGAVWSAEIGLVRVPSTFTFVTQYFTFLLGLLAVCHGMSRQATGQRSRLVRHAYLVFMVLIVLAAFVSGIRTAYVMIPGYFLIVAVLQGRLRRLLPAVGATLSLTAVGFVALAALLQTSLADTVAFGGGVLSEYLGSSGLIKEFQNALDVTTWGTGTGMGTGPARYAFDTSSLGSAGVSDEMIQIESFYAKAIVEAGLPGLVLVVGLFVTLLIRGFVSMRRVHDPGHRAFGEAILALLIVTSVYLIKGSVMDYDPLNVYFWLFAGVLMKLPSIDRNPAREEGSPLAAKAIASEVIL